MSIDTRILVTNSDGMGRYLAIRTYDDHMTITDESTSQVMTIALTTSVAGANTGDQVATTVPMTPAWGLDATNVQDAAQELSGSIAASAETSFWVATPNPLQVNTIVMADLATGIVRNTTATGVPVIAVAADFPTLNQNTTGTAANLSGTPDLPNGTTATTQGDNNNSTKLATTAFVQQEISNDTTKSPIAGPGSSQAFETGALTSASAQITAGFGCNGQSPQSAYTVRATATDLSTALTLVNQLRAALIANGIAV